MYSSTGLFIYFLRKVWPATNTCGVDGYERIGNPRLGEVERTRNYKILRHCFIGSGLYHSWLVLTGSEICDSLRLISRGRTGTDRCMSIIPYNQFPTFEKRGQTQRFRYRNSFSPLGQVSLVSLEIGLACKLKGKKLILYRSFWLLIFSKKIFINFFQ